MKKGLTFFVLALVMVLGVSLVSAQGGLPGSGWKSGQQIQNVGSANANIQFTAYDTGGTSFDCGSATVAPGASTTVLTDSDCPVVAGFAGSAVVSADQPIAAIVNVNNRGTSSAAGQYRGTDGADVATNIAFPLVKSDFGGRTTTFYVQNASGNTNTITANYNVGGTPYSNVYSNVPANAMVVVSPADAGVPAGSVGSLAVSGTEALAGSSLEHESSAAVGQNLQASKAFTPTDYDSVAYCPLVRNAHTANSQTTGIQAQNVSGAAQTITVDYSYSIGGGAIQTKSVTSTSLADGESFTFFGGDATNGIPAGALGSATVTGDSSGNIAVVVNDRGFASSNPVRVTTYSCFPKNSASTTVLLPLYKEFFGGNTAGIQVQNVSGNGTAATITVKYTSNNGDVVEISHSNPVADGSSTTFFGVSSLLAPSDATVVSGAAASLNATFGGVVITSNVPIVAIANESSSAPNPSNQDTKNYEGFPQ